MRSLTIPHILIALICCTCGFAAPEEGLVEIELGGGLSVTVAYDMNCKFIYLPGREVPISLPYGTYVNDAQVSPDRRHLLLSIERPRFNFGSDYHCCLHCERSDTSPTAKWTAKFVMHDTSLDLMFDRWTVVSSIVSIDDQGNATLRVAQGEKRVPPYRVIKTREVWDVSNSKRIKILNYDEPQ